MRNKRDSHKSADVLLICMPFGFLNTPSICITLLKEILDSLDIPTKLLYFTFRFSKMIGVNSYLKIFNQSSPRNLLGDWIFSKSLFEKSEADEAKYIDEILCRRVSSNGDDIEPTLKHFIKNVLKASQKVESFLDECLLEVLSYRPRIVGFTSVFHQQIASLSLAKRIKARSPGTFIVFGGPNCEGAMGVELIRQFPFVDAVVSGEAEIVFPQMVQSILAGKPPSGLQGVYTQNLQPTESTNEKYPNAHFVHNMDDLPFMNYDDYYEQLEASDIKLPSNPINLFETSRGCWWGEKRKCNFCGLNGENHPFRYKSSHRAIEELRWISKKYPGTPIQMVDNVLNLEYFKDFIPELASHDLGIDIFYETRPNLTKEQIRALRDAGIINIQPGLESLSTPVLKLMRKGASALQNIQLLKWCREFGLHPYWNFLYGFPLEPREEYERMANLTPSLAHLQPPGWISDLCLYRFSPYFKNPERYGLSGIAPLPVYQYIYPFEPKALANLAYFFSYHYHPPKRVEDYIKPVLKELYSWTKVHESSDLFYFDDGTQLLIWDQRPISSEFLIELAGLQRILYIACDKIRNISYLLKMVGKLNGGECSKEDIEKILQPLVDSKLMIREGHSYLSLAIPLGAYFPSKGTFERFQKHLEKIDELSSQESLMAKINLRELPTGVTVGKEEMKKSLRPDRKGGDLEMRGFV
jgi:ribosomal peptide maturation radical SAM protein 1